MTDIEDRLTTLEEKHNQVVDTAHKLFNNQQDQLDANSRRIDLMRDLLEKIYHILKEDASNGL